MAIRLEGSGVQSRQAVRDIKKNNEQTIKTMSKWKWYLCKSQNRIWCCLIPFILQLTVLLRLSLKAWPLRLSLLYVSDWLFLGCQAGRAGRNGPDVGQFALWRSRDLWRRSDYSDRRVSSSGCPRLGFFWDQLWYHTQPAKCLTPSPRPTCLTTRTKGVYSVVEQLLITPARKAFPHTPWHAAPCSFSYLNMREKFERSNHYDWGRDIWVSSSSLECVAVS